jgi:cytochrome P450
VKRYACRRRLCRAAGDWPSDGLPPNSRRRWLGRGTRRRIRRSLPGCVVRTRTGGGRAGPHVCLGVPPARMETTVAINALLDRLPDLHLDPTAPYPSINGVAFRSPAALPVEFTPA